MPEKEYLEYLYYTRYMTYADIAKECNATPASVCNWFKKYGIIPRKKGVQIHPHYYTDEERNRTRSIHKGKTVSEETRRKISNARKLHKAGHEKKRSDGYIGVYYPDHPDANKDGYVMKHRLIMEQKIGRRLKNNEVVHHKNHNRSDNRIDNLELMTASEHMSMHMKERYKK